eukprot:sb/3472922/
MSISAPILLSRASLDCSNLSGQCSDHSSRARMGQANALSLTGSNREKTLSHSPKSSPSEPACIILLVLRLGRIFNVTTTLLLVNLTAGFCLQKKNKLIYQSFGQIRISGRRRLDGVATRRYPSRRSSIKSAKIEKKLLETEYRRYQTVLRRGIDGIKWC